MCACLHAFLYVGCDWTSWVRVCIMCSGMGVRTCKDAGVCACVAILFSDRKQVLGHVLMDCIFGLLLLCRCDFSGLRWPASSWTSCNSCYLSFVQLMVRCLPHVLVFLCKLSEMYPYSQFCVCTGKASVCVRMLKFLMLPPCMPTCVCLYAHLYSTAHRECIHEIDKCVCLSDAFCRV